MSSVPCATNLDYDLTIPVKRCNSITIGAISGRTENSRADRIHVRVAVGDPLPVLALRCRKVEGTTVIGGYHGENLQAKDL